MRKRLPNFSGDIAMDFGGDAPVSHFFQLFYKEYPSRVDCFLTLFLKSNKIKKAWCVQRAKNAGISQRDFS